MALTKNTVYKVFLCFLLNACNNRSIHSRQENVASVQRSDTSDIFQIALKTAFYHGNLPGVEPLTKNDFILITSDTSYFKFIPLRVDTINFKIANRNDICSLLDKDFSKQLNYLYIKNIERIDSNYYYISIQNLSCKAYGGGGAIGIYLSKVNDSFVVKNYTSSSIN